MRPIKFRGRVPDNQGIDAGKIVCGSLLDYGEGTPNCPQFWIRPKDADRNFPVDKDSIAQLVGYDKNGNEFYEGDTVISEYGDEFLAELTSAVLTDEGFLHTDISFEILKVKEDSDETTD